jgi:hypothetical protein
MEGVKEVVEGLLPGKGSQSEATFSYSLLGKNFGRN